MLSKELEKTLLDNVVELTFVKKTNGEIRKMLCTKAYNLLNSIEGKTILGYRQPHGSPRYDLNIANNVVVWDINLKNYRTVSCDTVNVLHVIPQEQFLARLRLEK